MMFKINLQSILAFSNSLLRLTRLELYLFRSSFREAIICSKISWTVEKRDYVL